MLRIPKQRQYSRGQEKAREDKQKQWGRSALPAEDKRGRRIRRTCANGKDERVTRCVLMLFVEAEDQFNKHFFPEASLTIELRRSGRLTGTQNTAEPRHFGHSIKTSEKQTIIHASKKEA